MKKILVLGILICLTNVIRATEKLDYTIYHKRIIAAEVLITSENYLEAIAVYEELFDHYEFIFLRDYKIATQLALFLNDEQKAKKFLLKGIASGWQIKSIKKNTYLKPLLKGEEWKSIKKEYHDLKKKYDSKLNKKIQEQVKKMYTKDQNKAFMALFRFSSKAQDKYAENKFAPHSENQMDDFSQIIQTYGYPGEKLIGNSYWMSTILSHHNSISTVYTAKDSLYPNLKPNLKEALKNGQISPYEFLGIDDWYLTVKYNRTKPSYGMLDAPTASSLSKTNELRKNIYARPYEVRVALIDIQKKTGMNFYLLDRWY